VSPARLESSAAAKSGIGSDVANLSRGGSTVGIEPAFESPLWPPEPSARSFPATAATDGAPPPFSNFETLVAVLGVSPVPLSPLSESPVAELPVAELPIDESPAAVWGDWSVEPDVLADDSPEGELAAKRLPMSLDEFVESPTAPPAVAAFVALPFAAASAVGIMLAFVSLTGRELAEGRTRPADLGSAATRPLAFGLAALVS
jgi:hypothetical protein